MRPWQATLTEARFLARLIMAKAEVAGLADVVLSAIHALDRLGPQGAAPRAGYGASLLQVADELDKVAFRPLQR